MVHLGDILETCNRAFWTREHQVREVVRLRRAGQTDGCANV